ncbi:MAG: hypothetical protein RR946_00380 [Clostridia bacterium]
MILPAKFAASHSGVHAEQIGWIDFGTGFCLTAGAPPVHWINSFPNGFSVEFDICSVNQTASFTNWSAYMPPVSDKAPFGNTGYMGIAGHTVLYSGCPSAGDANETIYIQHLCIRNCQNRILKAARVVIADAFVVEGDSQLHVNTNGSAWSLMTILPPVSGCEGNTPVVFGVGTNRVTEKGQTSPCGFHPYAPVFAAELPTCLSIQTAIPACSAVGFAMGIVITEGCCGQDELMEAVALESAGLSHILNAEGEKIQAAVACGSIGQMLETNRSVEDVLREVTRLELALQSKLAEMGCRRCAKGRCGCGTECGLDCECGEKAPCNADFPHCGFDD